jgi:hypothetical protein
MKKLTLLIGLIAFVFTIGIQSCGSGAGGNTPGATVKKSLKLLSEKKLDKVMELYAKKDGTALTKEENGKMAGLMSLASAELDKKQGIKSIDILEEKIAEDGKTANVKWKITYGNGETDEDDGELVNVNGDWKMTIGN